MQIHIIAVGRMRPGPEREMVDGYLRRLRPPVTLKEVADRRGLKGGGRRDREAELLLRAAPKDAVAVMLDQKGDALDSAGLAARIGRWRDDGVRDLVFFIGGADGHGGAVRRRADYVLSLGPMTWPHILARVMLAEQLYRAASILSGHPYHRY